jgi:hypothetical protein
VRLERRGSGVGVGAGAGVEDTGSEMGVQDTGSEEALGWEMGGLRPPGRLSTSGGKQAVKTVAVVVVVVHLLGAVVE